MIAKEKKEEKLNKTANKNIKKQMNH